MRCVRVRKVECAILTERPNVLRLFDTKSEQRDRAAWYSNDQGSFDPSSASQIVKHG